MVLIRNVREDIVQARAKNSSSPSGPKIAESAYRRMSLGHTTYEKLPLRMKALCTKEGEKLKPLLRSSCLPAYLRILKQGTKKTFGRPKNT
jgi:hypothetical protein